MHVNLLNFKLSLIIIYWLIRAELKQITYDFGLIGALIESIYE